MGLIHHVMGMSVCPVVFQAVVHAGTCMLTLDFGGVNQQDVTDHVTAADGGSATFLQLEAEICCV